MVLGFPRGSQGLLKIHTVARRFTQFIFCDVFTENTFGNVSLVRITIVVRLLNPFTKSYSEAYIPPKHKS